MRRTPLISDDEVSIVPSAPLSRRRLLQVSGVGALALTLPSAAFAADAQNDPAPEELRRASYLGQIGQTFAVTGGPSLTLASVDDLTGAARNASLAGRDDAFVLTFTGAAGTALESATHELAHPVLGPIELFISPVGRDLRAPQFEAVVDRTVPLATAAKQAPAAAAEAGSPGATAGGLTAAAIPATAHAVLQRLRVTAKAKRVGKHVVATLAFPGGGIQAVEVQLLRNGKRFATASAAVRHGRAEVALKPKRALPRGSYDLVITATTTRGATKSAARTVKIAG